VEELACLPWRKQPLEAGAGPGGVPIVLWAGAPAPRFRKWRTGALDVTLFERRLCRLGFFEFSRHWSSSLLQAQPVRHVWTSKNQLQTGKNSLGVLVKKFLAWTAPGTIPTGAGDFNGLAPAVLEAFNGYLKLMSANLLEFGFRPGRALGRGLHSLQQKLVATALPLVLREWPCKNAVLGQVRPSHYRRTRYQIFGEEVMNVAFRCWHARQ
jgi:hypothetical protein